MKQTVVLPILLVISLCLQAQTISLNLPANKGMGITLALKQGIETDTVHSGRLDKEGYALITLPSTYQNYKGIAELRLERVGAYFEFIVAGEDMSLTCTEEYPHGANVIFKQSPENESLQRWFFSQSQRQEKRVLLTQLRGLYSDKDIRPFLDNELNRLQQQQQLFVDTLAQSQLYAARFIETRNLLSERISTLVFADSVQMTYFRAYVRDSLDINRLYTSGMWFDVLNGLLAVYDNDAPFHQEFINDMSLLLKRAESQKIYNTLSENIFTICESLGWNDLDEQLAYFLINDGRIDNSTGKLKKLMNLSKLSRGSKVPDLTQGRLPEGKILLIFYESGCGPCENEMTMLKANYSLLKDKGYEVVSIASDTDINVFRNTSQTFPWVHKYCDLKGFKGEDFLNYSVIGTPTFYIIDSNGTLQGRYARLVDTGILY